MKPLRIVLDLRRNTLEFRLRDDVGETMAWETHPATVDIGEAGRLLGVEVDLSAAPERAEPWRATTPPHGEYDPVTCTLYVALDSRVDMHARSASATARAGIDRDGRLMSLEIPRRGEGFEISYPSGNQ